METIEATRLSRQDEQNTLVSCSILKKEISCLVARNHWPVSIKFLPSSLHTSFEKLQHCLESTLERFPPDTVSVMFGTCHPLMDSIVEKRGALRTPGQNCVSILLGEQLFTEELTKGAFFLLEEWAHTWDEVTVPIFGKNPDLIKRIFSQEHSYLLAVRTPCSACFEKEASHVSEVTSLPLRWLDVSLENLENVLAETLRRRGSI
ncbi:MAG: DUF1638 domain-containing protein [Deltaproteobacteria bacterium]|nr:DUF1638 domain-containing protein [Deltaproteobacteria bacterium]TLN01281.1 MAG: DUF1638 domain-containing protein [bacterium]